MTDSEGAGGVPRLRPRGMLLTQHFLEHILEPEGRCLSALALVTKGGGGNGPLRESVPGAWRWEPGRLEGPAPDKPRSPVLQRRPAEGGGTSLGGGSAFSPLPWQRARLVSLRS